MALTVYHFPICPFSQRVEILLELKGIRDQVNFHVVDVTKRREDRILALSRGTTALPVMEVHDKTPLKESRVILEFVEAMFPGPAVARTDPHEHALESLLVQREGGFTTAGYSFVLNQDLGARSDLNDRMLAEWRAINETLENYAPGDTFFFDEFGWAETVFTPLFQRFWFLDYYEEFDLPADPGFDRARRWRDACLAHPAVGQVTFDQIVKLYYDYAKGEGNGALPEGRQRSSFEFLPHWSERPMPPCDKYRIAATDVELGLLPESAH